MVKDKIDTSKITMNNSDINMFLYNAFLDLIKMTRLDIRLIDIWKIIVFELCHSNLAITVILFLSC